MARIRTVKPEFATSEQTAAVSRSARLMFILMWCFCDDAGVHRASCRRLMMECFPGDDDVAIPQVEEWIRELVEVGLLRQYVVDGESYWHVTGWDKHQKIDRPTYRHPTPPKCETSTSHRRALDEPSPPEGKGMEGKGLGREGNGMEGKGSDESSRVDHIDISCSKNQEQRLVLRAQGAVDEAWQRAKRISRDLKQKGLKQADFNLVWKIAVLAHWREEAWLVSAREAVGKKKPRPENPISYWRTVLASETPGGNTALNRQLAWIKDETVPERKGGPKQAAVDWFVHVLENELKPPS